MDDNKRRAEYGMDALDVGHNWMNYEFKTLAFNAVSNILSYPKLL